MVKRRQSPNAPTGTETSFKLSMLEAGSHFIQDHAPLKGFDAYVVGLHCAKHDPAMQMEAHHYCKAINDDFFQCMLFDGNTKDANLVGVEYIISERLYESLPEEEKHYWHPHNYEVFSGQLVAPGLPDVAEKALLKKLVNSYGKTWHTWHSGRHDRPGEGDALPLGEATLMWSFNRDGESDPSLKEDRNAHMGIDTDKKREQRQDLVDLAHPQHGVDALKGRFPGASEAPPPGVVDADALPRTDE